MKINLKPVLMSVILFVGISLPTVHSQEPRQGDTGTAVRVGLFDSRAVAMAYYRSDAFKEHMKGLHADLEKAKSGGDTKRVQELETMGPAMQALAHKQGFGDWPIDDILRRIEDQLPEIAKHANVDLLVSKWDLAYRRKGLDFVDVTERMVAPFHPDESTRKLIRDIQKKDPIPMEQIEGHKH